MNRHPHRIFLVIGYALFTAGAITSCSVPVKKEIGSHHTALYPGDTTAPIPLIISIHSAIGAPINDRLCGFSTAFTFGSGAETAKQFIPLLEDIGVGLLRFPGGTIANFYHPNQPGYGFVKKEMGTIRAFSGLWKYQQKAKENIKVPFTVLAKKIQAQVVVVANLVTGTPAETMSLLDYFEENGVDVAAVELGNELFFKRYRKQFPDAAAYISACREFAGPIREKYPEIQILVCAPGKMEDGSEGRQPPFFSKWNEQLAREDFYQGYVVHAYFDLKNCKAQQGGERKNGFACLYKQMMSGVAAQINQLTDEMQAYYGTKKSMWITEWNLNPPGYWSNTFAHGAVVSSMLMGMATGNKIAAATYHNLAAGNDNYALVESKQLSSGIVELTPAIAYQVFKQFNQIASNGAGRLDFSIDVQSAEIPGISVWGNEKKKRWVWFVNQFGNKYVLSISGTAATKAKMQCVRGTTFMSGTKDSPGNTGKLYVEEYPLNLSNLALPPFSWGIIELEQ